MKLIPANGAHIPAIGFGTWTLDDNEAESMVSNAFAAGYRHIDTAAMYGNEQGVGKALAKLGQDRDSIFVTTKVWHDQIGEGDLQRSVAQSLDKLALDQVDLLLIHWPNNAIPLAETMAALNDVRDQGMTKHIGVANFTSSLIDEAAKLSDAPLACNQIEYHPMLDQAAVRAACSAHGIAITAYCPLAQGQALLTHPAITGPANRLGISSGQVALNWLARQDNVAAIPRTRKVERLEQNLNVFDLDLTDAEVAAIQALQSTGLRVVNPDFAPSWDKQ